MEGRSIIALNANAHVPALAAGKIDLAPNFVVPLSALKSAINVVAAAGTAGDLEFTFAGAYAVGDVVRLTVTSNLTSRQLFRKTYKHTVQVGATTVTDIALAMSKLMLADIGTVYASVTPALGVLTIVQKDDDKRGLVGYYYTDSAAGTIALVNTATTISEGQPSDLVDKGIDADTITEASYDTVRITFNYEVPIPFIDSAGVTAKEIYWFGKAGNGAGLVALIP